MVTKCTWLFNGSSNSGEKSFGFSETWYSGLTGDAVITAMEGVSTVRKLILAYGISIVGYRIQEGNGRAYVVRKSLSPPSSNDYPNLPLDSALCQVGVQGSPTLKKFFLHALPDDWVAQDRIVASRKAAILTVVDAYTAFNFQVRVVNPAAPATSILSITEAGLVETVGAHGLNVNDYVTLLRVRDINNRAIRGTFVVRTVPTNSTLTLAGWGGNTVGRSGKIRINQYSYLGATSLAARGIIGTGSRKVGRPFFQSRGRAPARR
jgi:hypothetical protein